MQWQTIQLSKDNTKLVAKVFSPPFLLSTTSEGVTILMDNEQIMNDIKD